MVSVLLMRTLPNRQPQGRMAEFDDGKEPKVGEEVHLDGFVWHRMPDFEPAVAHVRMEKATVAHSMPRRGDPRDPGAPRYDRRNRPVLLTSEEKATYAKKYEQHNKESCHYERTSSQGAFEDE